MIYFLQQLSAVELALLLCVLSLCLVCIFVAGLPRSFDQVWHPLGLFGAVYLFYFVLGPSIAIWTGNTAVAIIDYRQYYGNAWAAGAVGLSATMLGFFAAPGWLGRQLPDVHSEVSSRFLKAWFWVFGLFALVGVMFVIDKIGFNPVSAKHSEEFGIVALRTNAMWGYLYYCINIIISISVLSLAMALRRRRRSALYITAFICLVSLVIYAKVGFRGRILMMMIGLLVVSYLARRRRPSPLTIAVFGLSGLLMAATMVIVRRNFTNLDVGALRDQSVTDIGLQAFQDTSIFSTLGLVVESYPKELAFVGSEPLWAAAVLPIPRGFWPNKPTPTYIDGLTELTGNGGMAVPNIGEYYMAAGWPGIVFGSVVVGIVYGGIWKWYRRQKQGYLVFAIYAILYASIFPLVSRGYLGQFIQETAFTFGPLTVAWYFARRKKASQTFVKSASGSGSHRQAHSKWAAERGRLRGGGNPSTCG